LYPYSADDTEIALGPPALANLIDRNASSTHRRASGTVAGSLTECRSDGACLGLLNLGQHTLLDPNVDERLHGLHVLLAEQIVESRHVNEVYEASVELAVAVQVPESKPVLPVQVCVAAEHLLVHVLDLGLEALREA
jgi:hypothetical protein